MKTMLAILFLVFASNAEAAKDVSIENTNGGHITFTMLKGSCGDEMFIAYTTAKSGQVLDRGCWLYDEENERVFVLWNDGTVYEYK